MRSRDLIVIYNSVEFLAAVEGRNGEFQIVVDVECFAAYGCPSELDMRLDFNRVVNAAQ